MKHSSAKTGKTLSYLISDYTDLKDVVVTVEKMIADVESGQNKVELRKGCRLSITPLPDRQRFVLTIELHDLIDLSKTSKQV